LCIAIGVKLSSPGPVLFRQRRYGLDGRKIIVYKFRTMTVAEDGDVVRQATRNDSRITRFGAFLRRTSLDELPQFINVLQGRMSVVGRRPAAAGPDRRGDGARLRRRAAPGADSRPGRERGGLPRRRPRRRSDGKRAFLQDQRPTMCGIVGAVARRNVVPILIEGLKRLEYRGYDSAGIAVVNGKLHRVRSTGRVAQLDRL